MADDFFSTLCVALYWACSSAVTRPACIAALFNVIKSLWWAEAALFDVLDFGDFHIDKAMNINMILKYYNIAFELPSHSINCNKQSRSIATVQTSARLMI